MAKKFSEETKASLKKEMDKVAHKMTEVDDLDEFRKLKERYDVLSKMLEPSWTISPDTVAIISANLLGIVLILNHERLNIISSKAMSFVIKGRV